MKKIVLVILNLIYALFLSSCMTATAIHDGALTNLSEREILFGLGHAPLLVA